jgi:hypothetical protein
MNKNFTIILLTLLSVTSSIAQNAIDAATMGTFQSTGSARIMAMGNNSTALGGDISAIYQNPAGLSQYRTNELVLSPGLYFHSQRMEYDNASFKDNRTRLNLGATGVILSFYSQKRQKVRRTNFGIALNQTANFNTAFRYNGINRNSSYSEKWVEELISNNVQNIEDAFSFSPAGASLAVENYLIDTSTNVNGQKGYITNANTSFLPIDQRFTYRISGSVNELAIGLSSHHTERFYYGMSLGIPMFSRTETTTVEENDASGNTDNDFASFRFKETIRTRGTGILLRGGIIFKPFEQFRIGFNIQSPAFYTLTRSMDANLKTDVENYAKKSTNDPNRSQQFELSTRDITGENYFYDYQFSTPWQMSLALAYVFRETADTKLQRAMITGGVELINHRSARFSSSSEFDNSRSSSYFKEINNDVKSLFRPALQYKLGGELKWHTLMFRGGIQYLSSPYKKEVLPDGIKGYRLIPSLGIGYRDKGIFADFTYAHTLGDDVHFPYVLTGNIYPFAAANINRGQILITVGTKF